MHLRVKDLRKSYDGTDVVAGLDLELEPRDEGRRVDERAEPAAGGRRLGECAANVRRLHGGIHTIGRASALSADGHGESACVVGAQPQTTDDVPLAQGIVGRIQVEIAMLRALWLGSLQRLGKRCAGQLGEVPSRPYFVAPGQFVFTQSSPISLFTRFGSLIVL